MTAFERHPEVPFAMWPAEPLRPYLVPARKAAYRLQMQNFVDCSGYGSLPFEWEMQIFLAPKSG